MRDYEEKSYYEIQLDNKQLILVFLAAVTVCVLIFVLGVMIGKGQKEAEFAAASRDEKRLAASEPDPNSPQQPVADIAPDTQTQDPQEPKELIAEDSNPKKEAPKKKDEPAAAAAPVKQEEKFAYEELDKADKPPAPAAVAESKASPREASPAPPKVETTAVEQEEEETEPKPAGRSRYTVQVMATSSRPKAQEQLTRLKSRGYDPFMDESKTGDVSVFKVRVGRFADAQEAKEMASKIKSDLKLESWVAPLD
jgi:cell division septation protein DedD